MAVTSSGSAPPHEARPYRPHKAPACDLCRTRKIRCNTDIPGQACRFCRERSVNCLFTSGTVKPVASPVPGPRRAKRRRTHSFSEIDEPGAAAHTDGPRSGLSQYPGVLGTSPTESSLLMNPTMAGDIDVLEKYLTAKPTSTESSARLPYSVISDTPGKPIIYLSYPRRRKGLQFPVDPGSSQREVLDQILNLHQTDVIQLYFENLHPCFPIVDKKTLELWKKDPGRISSTLVCDIYASALTFWHKSDILKAHAQPDQNFVWNQAVKALQDDFMAPSISTIHSALLDLTGRPILQISGNIVNAGRTITLAHGLVYIEISPGGKRQNMRKSSSLAHGMPPNIQRANYDVPLPTLESLLSSSVIPQEQSSNAGMTFVKLCSLTQILGSLLPLLPHSSNSSPVYMNFNSKNSGYPKRLQIARDTSGWDLSDFCLERCSFPIEQIASAISVSIANSGQAPNRMTENRNAEDVTNTHKEPSVTPMQNDSPYYHVDFMLPIDPWDIPWEGLWD
ncbi:hypothetical protein BKA65DRAFT_585911 [Rhexocercosporidium sp. MPI-PUGE-AT-0058]|nr:hypothetical protein BKA65DRAFT_585911 [Rhexocercosporidium sp. MPI-PUGE-AT-0058]